jgi:hypothetical protein
MNAHVRIENPAELIREFQRKEALFDKVCHDWAARSALGLASKQMAADHLQHLAEGWGLIEVYGQAEIQERMAEAFVWAERAPEDPPKPKYKTPRSTIDAFWYVVRLKDPAHLLRWLDEHPRDSAFLKKLLEDRCKTKS